MCEMTYSFAIRIYNMNCKVHFLLAAPQLLEVAISVFVEVLPLNQVKLYVEKTIIP